MTEAASCAWCSHPFRPRATGGHAQRFCRPVCRRAFDAAGRRWVADAISGGTLTVAALRSGYAATRALVAEAISSVPVSEAREPAPVALTERDHEAEDLLGGLLVALLDLLGDGWADLVAGLPDELYDRIDRWMEARFV